MRRNTGRGRGGACQRDFVWVSRGGEVLLPLDKSRRGCFDRYGLGNGYASIGTLCCVLQCRTLRYKGHGLQPIRCACRVEGWYFALVLRRFFVAQFFWASGVAIIRFIDAGRKG